jgi:hypothetical protein
VSSGTPQLSGGGMVTVPEEFMRSLMEKVEAMERSARESNANLRQSQAQVDLLLRREVIRDPRASFTVQHSALSPSATVNMGASPPPVRHVHGRETLSPVRNQLNSSITSEVEDAEPEEKAADVEEHRKALDRLMKKAEGPATFSGDTAKDKIADVRDWVDSVDSFIEMIMGDNTKGALDYVVTRTVGAAQEWLRSKKSELRNATRAGGLRGGVVEWNEIRPLFIEQFEGQEYRQLKKIEMDNLRIGTAEGEFKTLPLFNSRFDQLARRVYPAGSDKILHDQLLADKYSELIRMSDKVLWREMNKMVPPQGLAGWKELTAQFWAGREVVRLMGQDDRKKFIFQRGGKAGNFSAVSAQAVQTEVGSDEDTEPGQEGQQWTQVGANQAQVRGGGGTGAKGPFRPASLSLCTDDEVKKILANRLCFQCFKKGHRAGDAACKEKGKAKRKPTSEELKA